MKLQYLALLLVVWLSNLGAMQSSHETFLLVSELYAQQGAGIMPGDAEAATVEEYMRRCDCEAVRLPHDPARLAFWQYKFRLIDGAMQEMTLGECPMVRILGGIKRNIQVKCDFFQPPEVSCFFSRWGERLGWLGRASLSTGGAVVSAVNPMRYLRKKAKGKDKED